MQRFSFTHLLDPPQLPSFQNARVGFFFLGLLSADEVIWQSV